MDSTRWQRIQTLFHDAADLPPSQQSVFLRSACGNDEELFAHVLAMLEEDQQSASLLDRQLAEVAHETLEQERPAPTPAREFGPYRVLRLLGEGGMGVVYLAERTDLGNQVAVKLLRDSWLSPARRERFSAEQKTLAQLNHPSIARLYDADTLPDGTPWFAMELVDGVPLTEYCRKHSCEIAERLQLFRRVCEAVRFAHQNAVIHRDLKPSNILVKADGTVKLLDFGIAKQIESLDVSVDQTMTALRLMTPAYAAPEQIRGDRIGIQTDVYSLGVILYELLTEQLPYDLSNLTPAEAATVIVGHEPGKPSVAARRSGGLANISKAAWGDLDVLCLTAMHKDPRRRYQSVEAVIRDIDHYLKEEPLDARPDSLRYRAGKFVGRHRRGVIASALVTTLLLGMAAFFTVRLAKAHNAALEEAARTQRVQRFMMNLFQGGDEAAGPSDDLKVITLVDRGVQEADALNSDPRVQAELYATLGGIYQKLGKLDRADSLLSKSLQQRKSLFGTDSPEAAESLIELGQLRADQAKLEDAEKLIRQGLNIDKRRLPADHPAVAKAMIALGNVLSQRGSYDEAIRTLQDAVNLQSRTNAAPADVANGLSALADANYRAGHYDVCNSLYRRLLEMHRQQYGDRHPLVAQDLGNLGAIQDDLGYYSEAEKFKRQALDITEAYYGKGNPKTAACLTALGQSLQYQKKFDEAKALLEQALAIQEHVYGPTHPAVADALNELGNVAYMRDQYDEAEARFSREVDIYRAVYGDHHYLVATALSNLASVSMDKKDYPHAERLFRQVVKLYSETLSPDNVNTGIAHIKLGRTLLREKKFGEATEESLAGYNVLIKQTSTATTFVHAARKDLVADYEGLNLPEKAEKFRAELVAEKK